MMLWIHLVIFTGFVGIVSGSISCLATKSQDCKSKLAAQLREIDAACTKMLLFIDCLKEASRECGEETNPDFIETSNFLTEMCQDGTELNRQFLKHKDCIFQSLPQSSKCFEILTEASSELSKANQPTADVAVKIACKYVDEVLKCLFGHVANSCGPEAENLFRKGINADRKLGEALCREKGYYMSGEANLFPVNPAVTVLQFLLLIFLSKLFF